MRANVVALMAVVGLACGKTAPDGGVAPDGGAQGDAGAGSACLADALDAGEAPDDGGRDFSCRGQAPGEGGQAELVIAGKATRAGLARLPLPGVQLELLDLAGAVLASATADDGGAYQLVADAGCAPLDGEVRATHPDPDGGFYLSYAVPFEPWRYDRGGLELVLFDKVARSLVAGFASVTLVDGTAVLALTVTDCAGRPVADAVVSTADDAGTVRYVGSSGLPTTTLAATGSGGEAVIFNLPGARVEVTAWLDGGVVGRRVVPIHADAATGTVLGP